MTYRRLSFFQICLDTACWHLFILKSLTFQEWRTQSSQVPLNVGENRVQMEITSLYMEALCLKWRYLVLGGGERGRGVVGSFWRLQQQRSEDTFG